MITIVDYGLGNIAAFLNVYKRSNIAATAARSAAEVERATRLILPGVGSFDNAMRRLGASGMRPALTERVVEAGVPVLGVCVGMQMLARSNDEGTEQGLGWIDATVRDLRALAGGSAAALPLPHMGWNDVVPAGGDGDGDRSVAGLFAGLETGSRFYFLHSYYIECDRPEDAAATTRYGAEFACAVKRGNVHGVQFHPEKSHQFGARLLRNFAAV